MQTATILVVCESGFLGLNRDQTRYRIEKFKLERPATTQARATCRSFRG